ncbi:MAG: hypothetical protein HKN15_12915 [Xanthomonadales bacterium]|nr:hypothetical protein [Xanthomonadales bacterium]
MKPCRLRFALALGAWMFFAASWAAPESSSDDTSEISHLTILVPAEPGGGWDLTAKAMSETLQQEGLVNSVDIEYSPGAGGVIGLAQFLVARKGQGDAVLVGGMFTVGAVIQNHSAVSLLDASPLARLTYDNAAVAVPSSSSFKTIDGLFEAMLSAPDSLSWVGGSKAGVDELNLHEIARALGIPPSRLHYTGLPGGGEVAAALAAGRHQAGISGFSEFETAFKNQQIRILAVLNNEGMQGSEFPSFSKLGIKIKRRNWRGVFAAPGLDEKQLGRLFSLIQSMVSTATWQHQLEKHQWLDAYLGGTEFSRFVESEQTLAEQELDLMSKADPAAERIIGSVLLRRYAWAIALAAVSILLVTILIYQRHRAHQREEGLQQAYEAATGEAMLHTEALEKALYDIQNHIQQEFDRWSLTLAEKEIALLLLKGLRLKDIAESRGTSERTVRQQAQAVYKKAGLDGRFELAAYFIEDVIQSMELQDKHVNPV